MPQTTKIMKSKPNQPTADDSAFTAAPCSDYECGDEVTIEGHGTRTVNAQIGEYLFLDTDTDGPFIDTVHVSFAQNSNPTEGQPKGYTDKGFGLTDHQAAAKIYMANRYVIQDSDDGTFYDSYGHTDDILSATLYFSKKDALAWCNEWNKVVEVCITFKIVEEV